MRKPEIPYNEEARLRKLRQYRVLDSSPEPAFDGLTRLAAHVTGTRVALVSLLDANRQWFKSRHGTDVCETPRDISFCGHVLESESLLVVPDASKDERFADNPLVTGETHVRFYAGAPLRTVDNFILGTLCVIDDQPRDLDSAQIEMLSLLAQQVVDQLELRHSQLVSQEQQSIQSALLNSLPGLYFHLDQDGVFLDVHGVSREQLYAEPSMFIGKRVEDVLSLDAAAAINQAIERTKQQKTVQTCRYHLEISGHREHFEARIALATDGSIVVLVNGITEAQGQKELLEAVCRAQTSFLASAELKVTFDGLLGDLLSLTHSEYGFIGEVLRGPDGAPYLKTHAITNIAWDDTTRQFFDEHSAKGLEFHNLKTLFGAALTTGREVIANAPAADPRRGGLPQGHPPLNSFLGLPLHSGDEMIGLIGLSNRESGYDHNLVKFLRPLSMTIARLIELVRSTRAKAEIERELEDRDAQYRRIVELSQEGIWVLDANWQTTFVNERMASMLGKSAPELLGQPFLAFVDEATPGEVLERLEKRRLGIHASEDFRLRSANGDVLWVAIATTPIFDNQGRFQSLLTMVMDITARRHSEQLIREREHRFRSIVDTAIDAIVTIDESGIIRHANPAVERLFGFGVAEVIGQNVSLLMPSPEREQHDGYLLRYKQTGRRHIVGIGRETNACRKNGEIFPAELAVSEFYIDGTKYFTGVIRDLSDRKRIERLQSEFISTVSHELRTPLTSIRGSLGLVAAGITGELPTEAKEYVDIAVTNSDRLVRLINDILDIEKMQSGKMEFRFRATDLETTVLSAVAANRALAAGQDVRLVATANWPKGEVLVDPDRLAQVLTNLISNAVKFSPVNGEVELSVKRIEGYLRVSIRDQGPGISPEFRERIFQRFAQGDASSTRKKGGTGLGLAISKAIMDMMQGRIGFEPASGGGSIFYFDLPFLTSAEVKNDTLSSARRILVCEADPTLARVIEGHLATTSCTVDVASSFDEARQLLALEHYDVTTLDLDLADGGASALVADMRQACGELPSPIVAITDAHSRNESVPPGVAAVVSKPLDRKRLLDAIWYASRSEALAPPRILYVESDVDLRKIVKRTFPGDWVVVEASRIVEARRALETQSFDIALMDLALPDGAAQELFDRVGSAKIIIFSAAEVASPLTRRVAASLVKSHSHPSDVRDVILSLLGYSCQERVV